MEIILGILIGLTCVIDGIAYANKSWEIFHKGAQTKADEMWRFFLFPTAHAISMFRGKNPGASGLLIRFCKRRWLYSVFNILLWPLRLAYSVTVLALTVLSLPYLLLRA